MLNSKGKFEANGGCKPMLKSFYRLFIELTNGRYTSAVMRKFTSSKVSKFLIPTYAKVFNINKEEMDKPLNEYDSLHELFIRTLKKGVRPISVGEKVVVSPVDAVIEQIGVITPERQMKVKNKDYSLKEMFEDETSLEKYVGGTFIIFYLSPRDYHRIHSPINGEVIKSWTLGKKSYPVNKYGLKFGKSPLTKNYRTITEIKHDGGHMTVAKIGAMFVNSIEQTYIGTEVEKGKEIAYFSFGSTVILFFEKNTFTRNVAIKDGMKIKVGEAIGYLSQLLN